MNKVLSHTRTKLSALQNDTRGATMVEYVLILALILVAAIASWKAIGAAVTAKTAAAAAALQ